MPPTAIPDADCLPWRRRAEAGTVLIRNKDTGYGFYVPVGSLEAERSQELRRRVKLGDVQADGLTEDEVVVDGEHRTYRLKSYPALGRVLLPPVKWGFMRNMYWYIVFGAFLFAACAQIKFYFPCFNGYTAVPWGANSYCVPDGRVAEVTAASCPADICSKRIPVNLSTYAAMLNGALAGMTGVWATVLYVAMVCVGAPFGSSSISEPMWKKGAIIGPTGGFFWGFIFASLIMARCTQHGHDRPRSAYMLILWLLASEVTMYACGLFWLPFGMAISRGVSPSAICPASAGAGPCLNNILNWGLVPFIPGEVFKMALVMVTLPLAWQLTLWVARWRSRERLAAAAADNHDLLKPRGINEAAGKAVPACADSTGSLSLLDEAVPATSADTGKRLDEPGVPAAV